MTPVDPRSDKFVFRTLRCLESEAYERALDEFSKRLGVSEKTAEQLIAVVTFAVPHPARTEVTFHLVPPLSKEKSDV